MNRILLLCIILIACNESQKNTGFQGKKDAKIVWRMNNKVTEYLSLPTMDSARDYLARMEDTLKEVNDEKLAFYWNLAKVQQLNIEERYDSAGIFMNNALTFFGSKDINPYDSFNLYTIYDKLLKDQKLYDSALRVAN